ncbi:MAG: ankyrin repeat domain-containing protein [Opitutae bacterium]|nr:ankyrin repeat domain-containing protein [Opitutae bacterium]
MIAPLFRLGLRLALASVICSSVAGATSATPTARLLEAALHGNLQEIRRAVQDGAEINARNANGDTALSLVAKLSYYNVVRFLVEQGAEVNVANHDRITPLHWGVEYNNVRIVKLLLEKGADVHATDKIQETPLHWAGWTGSLEAAKLLLDYGANPYAGNNTGVTPIFNAQRQEHTELHELLTREEYRRKFKPDATR